MAKSKTPYFSLGARGTVGEAITAQKLARQTMLRGKPLPTDPYSLDQAYQRWLYQDYVYRWHQQTAATKQEYQSAGVPYHLTGFQYWMRYQLANLPDIVAWYKLDHLLGGNAPDSSRNGYDGTVIGASLGPGTIAGGKDFDGINDYISTDLLLPPIGTVEYWLDPVAAAGTRRECYFAGMSPTGDFFSHQSWDNGTTSWRATNGGVIGWILIVQPYPLGPFLVHHLWDGPAGTSSLYWNNVHIGSVVIWPPTCDIHDPLYIGARQQAGTFTLPSESNIDNLIVYNRQLDPTERARHLLRRYPP